MRGAAGGTNNFTVEEREEEEIHALTHSRLIAFSQIKMRKNEIGRGRD